MCKCSLIMTSQHIIAILFYIKGKRESVVTRLESSKPGPQNQAV